MKYALEIKSQGNEYFEQELYHEAINQYERSLSIFHWIVNKKHNWRREEIEDDMLKEFEYVTDNIEEKNEINKLRCSCLLNMAFAFQKLAQWNDW